MTRFLNSDAYFQLFLSFSKGTILFMRKDTNFGLDLQVIVWIFFKKCFLCNVLLEENMVHSPIEKS